MKKSLKAITLSVFLLSGVVFASDFNLEAFAEPVQSAMPGDNYSRRTYRPRQKRRLRNIGYVGDYSDIACHTWLTPDDVYYLSATELRILRNTIYARHGRRFKDAKLRRYFSQFDWYYPTRNEISPSELSETEKHNISLIQSFEY